MDFYNKIGKMALGSRLRRLSDTITEEATKVYQLYDVALQPKWFPVFYTLSQQQKCSVSEVAQIIGQSHVSVSNIAKEMRKAGLVSLSKSKSDGRVSELKLTEKGKSLLPKIEKQYKDVDATIEELFGEMQENLWRAIEEIEFLLGQRDFYSRVRDQRKYRESQLVEIIDYKPKYHEDFKRLNYEWIEKYFTVEDADRQALEHPNEKILKPGGHIFLAQYEGEIVGTCAMIKVGKTFELAKMAVTESAQGKNIGWLLGQAVIKKARTLGAKKLYLESNTRLEPAINLYYKLGFQRIVGKPSPYERSNIQMELEL
ncbi:MAG: MarR family transcriptional regulator [Saprospiraceae bacterium]|nr:MarR family transcriptional regulator [Saprospiraceae bacterium]